MQNKSINGFILLSQMTKGMLFNFIEKQHNSTFELLSNDNGFFMYRKPDSKQILKTPFNFRVKLLF